MKILLKINQFFIYRNHLFDEIERLCLQVSHRYGHVTQNTLVFKQTDKNIIEGNLMKILGKFLNTFLVI